MIFEIIKKDIKCHFLMIGDGGPQGSQGFKGDALRDVFIYHDRYIVCDSTQYWIRLARQCSLISFFRFFHYAGDTGSTGTPGSQ